MFRLTTVISFISLCFITGHCQDAQAGRCPLTVDIAFLVDSSGSVERDFPKEIHFVTAIADIIGISKSGSHAAVVQFSSEGFVTIPIKFNDYLDLKQFQNAVKSLKTTGGETRIDLALQIAHRELFTAKGGARSYTKKMVVLITDGVQYPAMHRVTGNYLNPAKSAKLLHDQGVQIFAIAVGQNTNKTQLTEITRKEERVFGAQNFEELTSVEFTRTFGNYLCGQNKAGNLGNKTNPCENGIPTYGTRCHCSQRPIYVNIFLGGNNVVLHGFNLSDQDPPNADIINIKVRQDEERSRKVSDESDTLKNMLQKIFPDDPDLIETINDLASKKSGMEALERIEERNQGKRRRRRDLLQQNTKYNKIQNRKVNQDPLVLASEMGADMIIRLFKKEMRQLLDQNSRNPNITILLPSNEAVQKLTREIWKSKGSFKMKQDINYHIAEPLDSLWSYLRDLKTKRVYRSYVDITGGKEITMIENAAVIKGPLKAGNMTLFIVNETINYPDEDFLKITSKISNVSIFANMMKVSGMRQGLKSSSFPSEICLYPDICFPLHGSIKERLEMLSQLRQYTIFAPTNEAIKAIPKEDLKDLLSNKERLRNAVGAHIVYGTIFSKSINMKGRYISPSFSKDNIIKMVTMDASTRKIKFSNLPQTKSANVIHQDIRSSDAVLHIVDKFFYK